MHDGMTAKRLRTESRPERVRDNVKASGVVLDGAIMKRIDEALGGVVERDPKKTASPPKRP